LAALAGTIDASEYARPVSIVDTGGSGHMVLKSTVNDDCPLSGCCINDVKARQPSSPDPPEDARGPGPSRRWTTSFRGRKKSESTTRSPPLAAPTSDDFMSTPLKMSGLLSVPFTKLHIWKKRWCVLTDMDFTIYKDAASEQASDIPLARVEINSFLQVCRPPGTSEQKVREFVLRAGDATHLFLADSIEAKEAWLTALDAKIAAVDVGKTKASVLSGWLTKSRQGYSKRRWCSLLGRTLYYSASERSPPIGSLKIYRARIEIDLVDSDTEEGDLDTERSHCFRITSARGKHYFLAASPDELRKWTFFLHLAAGSLTDDLCTETERILKTLSEQNSKDLSEPLFQSPILTFDKKAGDSPELLTTLPSKAVEEKALSITKSIHLYTSVVMQRAAISYHARLAQEILTMTATEPGLHNEIYCQLIRLTNGHPYPNNAAFMQCWHLLVLMIPLCLPTTFFLRYLGLHLLRNIKSTLPCAGIAEYGKRCLQRTLRKGVRTMPASVTEIFSVVDQSVTSGQPQAMSIRIKLPTGSEFVCGFDPQTTCADMATFISKRLTMRSPVQSGYGLFVSDPTGASTWHSVCGNAKVCDILASWELAFREARVGRVDYHAVPQILFQRRLHFRAKQCDDEVESILLAYQISSEISSGRFKVADEHIAHMTALIAQMEWGDHTDAFTLKERMSEVVAFLPPHSRRSLVRPADQLNAKELFNQSKNLERFGQDFVKEWKAMKKTPARSLGRTFVAIAKAWRMCGAALYEASETASGFSGWLAVHEDGVTILQQDTFDELDEIAYEDILKFGISAGKLRLEKRSAKGGPIYLTFDVKGDSGPDCVYTMTSYVNAILRRDGITSNYAKIWIGPSTCASSAEGGHAAADGKSPTVRPKRSPSGGRRGATAMRPRHGAAPKK